MEMIKYFWYGELGFSDDFATYEECEQDAMSAVEQYHLECGIYCYDANKFPNGDMDIDDCTYVGYVSEC